MSDNKIEIAHPIQGPEINRERLVAELERDARRGSKGGPLDREIEREIEEMKERLRREHATRANNHRE